MKDEDVIGELATEYSARDMDSLDKMEAAIKLARSIKADMKRDDVPEEEVEHLRAAWKLCERRERVEMLIKVVIEIAPGDSDPASVYPNVVAPECMRDWDAYDLVAQDIPTQIKVFDAVKRLQDLLTTANKIHYEFTQKHDVPATDFLDAEIARNKKLDEISKIFVEARGGSL